MQAQIVVTHATTYNVLVGGVVFYPLRVTIKVWEEIAYYRPRWYTRVNCKTLLSVRFIEGQVRKSNMSTMLVRF